MRSDAAFSGSIPSLYEEYLVPLIFEQYAEDIAARVAARNPESVLEIAAGTGVVTRKLAKILPSSARIVATDLNQAMIDQAQSVGTSRPVEWQQADATQLPFSDEAFDVVVCQFGIMFFPDKAKALSEARRVLKPSGRLIFNVWDRLQDNELADVIAESLATLFPDDPPRFLSRVPYAYNDRLIIAKDLEEGGFEKPHTAATLTMRSQAANASIPAIAYCQGTPVRSEIEARDGSKLGLATESARAAIEERFGAGPLDTKIQAVVFEVAK